MGEFDRWEKSEKLKTVQRRLHQQVLIVPTPHPPSRYAAVHHCVTTVLSRSVVTVRGLGEDIICLPSPLVSVLVSYVFRLRVSMVFSRQGLAGRPCSSLYLHPTDYRTYNFSDFYQQLSCAQVQIYWGFHLVHTSSNAWLQLEFLVASMKVRFVWELSLDRPWDQYLCYSQMKRNWSGCSGTNQEPLRPKPAPETCWDISDTFTSLWKERVTTKKETLLPGNIFSASWT